MLTSLFSLFYVTGEFHRFLHRGIAGTFMVLKLKTHFQLVLFEVMSSSK